MCCRLSSEHAFWNCPTFRPSLCLLDGPQIFPFATVSRSSVDDFAGKKPFERKAISNWITRLYHSEVTRENSDSLQGLICFRGGRAKVGRGNRISLLSNVPVASLLFCLLCGEFPSSVWAHISTWEIHYWKSNKFSDPNNNIYKISIVKLSLSALMYLRHKDYKQPITD